MAAALALFSAPVTANTLSAEVDRTTVGLDETLTLRLRLEGRQASSDPNLAGLVDQFEILSNQRSTQTRIINNNVQMFTEWILTLSPKDTGKLEIPSFSMEGQDSNPITITVTNAAVNPDSGRQDVFIQTTVDKSEVFVQEQFLVTYRLFFNQNIEALDKDDFKIDNTRIEAAPRMDYQRTIGNTQYGVAEYRYAVFPDASGNITIPSATWTVRTSDQPNVGRFNRHTGRYRLHRPKTEDIHVEVKPTPDQYPADQAWLPTEELTLSENWSRTPDQFKVGEPLTRDITITAKGVGPEQLPPLAENSRSGDFRFYPDQPSQDKRFDDHGLTGIRKESITIIPSRAGRLTLPEVSVTWWDTNEQKIKTTSLPERTVVVAESPEASPTPDATAPTGAVSTSPPPPGAPTQTAVNLWPWLVLIAFFMGLSAVFAGLWWRLHSSLPDRGDQPAKQPTNQHRQLNQARRTVIKECQKAAPTELRSALMHWARLKWNDKTLCSLSSLESQSSSPEFAAQLRNLDAKIFKDPDTVVDYQIIQNAVASLSSEKSKKPTTGELKSLYAD